MVKTNSPERSKFVNSLRASPSVKIVAVNLPFTIVLSNVVLACEAVSLPPTVYEAETMSDTFGIWLNKICNGIIGVKPKPTPEIVKALEVSVFELATGIRTPFVLIRV